MSLKMVKQSTRLRNCVLSLLLVLACYLKIDETKLDRGAPKRHIDAKELTQIKERLQVMVVVDISGSYEEILFQLAKLNGNPAFTLFNLTFMVTMKGNPNFLLCCNSKHASVKNKSCNMTILKLVY